MCIYHADVPFLPDVSAIGYMAHFDHFAVVFAFYAILPKRDKCAKNLPISYEASYRLQNCTKRGEWGSFVCSQVQDSDVKDKDLFCYAESLTVCREEKLAECKMQIDLTARNSFGISTAMSFVSDYVSNAGEPSFLFLSVL